MNKGAITTGFSGDGVLEKIITCYAKYFKVDSRVSLTKVTTLLFIDIEMGLQRGLGF